jgi:urease subunit gamma/beta
VSLLSQNVPEATAVLATQVIELVRDGHSLSTIMDLGRQMLGRRQVIPGIAEILEGVQVATLFVQRTSHV